MVKLTMPDNSVREYPEGISVEQVGLDWKGDYSSPLAEGIFNGVAANLKKRIKTDGTIDFVELNSLEGNRCLVRSILFLLVVALRELYPDITLEVRNSLGNALFCTTHGSKLGQADLERVKKRMWEIVETKAPIWYYHMSRQEAEDLFRSSDRMKDSHLGLLDMIPEGIDIIVNELRGVKSLFAGPLLPTVENIRAFELIEFENGFVINHPVPRDYSTVQPWDRRRRINAVYSETEEWAAMLGCDKVWKLNRIIREGKAVRIIRVAEALQEKKFAQIADKIAADRNIKIVLIAGPSSSGKTTSSQRISIQMEVNGLRPIPISMDNYYVNREDTPKKPDGSYDFECVEAIDVKLFNEQLKDLLDGKSVRMPRYNFKTGMREYTDEEVRMEENSVFVIEGIHALNRRLTSLVPDEKKFRIFVSALTPMSIDDYNRLHTTDMRLIRRIVRDNQFRSHDALSTIKMWPSVREGEDKYIFSCQEEADVFVNTTLIYEQAVLKRYVEPLLRKVPFEERDAYFVARRLLEIFALFEPLDDKAVPSNSILKEFLGGSAFSDVL